MKYQINTNYSELEINEILSIYEYMKYFYFHISDDLIKNISILNFGNDIIEWKKYILSQMNKSEYEQLKKYINILYKKYNIFYEYKELHITFCYKDNCFIEFDDIFFYEKWYKIFKYHIMKYFNLPDLHIYQNMINYLYMENESLNIDYISNIEKTKSLWSKYRY
jgi:hypothetical protein